jgi:hypothetical protein
MLLFDQVREAADALAPAGREEIGKARRPGVPAYHSLRPGVIIEELPDTAELYETLPATPKPSVKLADGLGECQGCIDTIGLSHEQDGFTDGEEA